jgi:hypothetical protein
MSCTYTTQGRLQCAREEFAPNPPPMALPPGAKLAPLMLPYGSQFASVQDYLKSVTMVRRVSAAENTKRGRRRIEKFDVPQSDRVVSPWSSWSPCISSDPQNCNGVQFRTRTVTQPPADKGKPCPLLSDMQRCLVDPQRCRACASSDQKYLDRYPDVRKRGTKPWDDFTKSGQAQNRVYEKC